MRRLVIRVVRGGALALIGLVLLVGLAAVSLETPTGKRFLLGLAIGQAGRLLTVPLEIAELRGSIYRGLELVNVRLVRNGEALVSIERVELDYTIAELLSGGTRIRSIRLTRPQIVGAREADGSWNLAGLLRRSAPTGRRPARAVTIESLEIVNGLVVLKDPIVLAGMRVPRRYERLNTSLRIQTGPGRWSVDVKHASWLGGPSDLAVDLLTGKIESDPAALTFTDLVVRTAQSAVKVDGRVIRGGRPATLDLQASADRFVFQEWGVVIPALLKIPIDAKFDAALSGPLAQLAVNLDLQSNGGDARGPVVLNTTIPGWHGSGTLDLTRLNLEPWFNSPAQKSDISGRATFDLALQLGRGVPQGSYMFTGSHAAYKGYAGNDLRARGDVTGSNWRIAEGSAVAYGASVRMSAGTIGLKQPHDFRFVGHASNVDLRKLPETIPVPHVESRIGVAFDVDGNFSSAAIGGSGVFDESEFIGARIAPGATAEFIAPARYYQGSGFVSSVDVNRWGRELDVAWMQDPRYAGTVTGDFHAEWAGRSSHLLAGGRLERANLFGGTLTDADIDLELDSMWLTGTYRGAFAGIDPSRAFEDERYAASLTGTADATIDVAGLLEDAPVDTYQVRGTAELTYSQFADLAIDRASIEGSLIVDPDRESSVDFSRLNAEGPRFAIDADGTLPLADGGERVKFVYTIPRIDLTLIDEYLEAGTGVQNGTLATTGVMEGPPSAVRAAGEATITGLALPRATVSTVTAKYDATFPWNEPSSLVATADATATSIAAFGRAFEAITGTGTYERGRIASTLTLLENMEPRATVASTVVLHEDESAADVEALALSFEGQDWRMVSATPSPIVRWSDAGVTVAPARFVDAMTGEQSLALSGNWRADGQGALEVSGRGLSLDALTASDGGPAPYGGRVDIDATLRGTIDRPQVDAQLTITEGRVRRLTYERLAGKVNYGADAITLDMRIDQAPGVWLTVAGTVPPTAATGVRDDGPIDLTVVSSDIGLGLLEGLTSAVRNVAGRARGNVRITGSSQTPLFVGEVDISDAAFQVAASGAQYRNGRARLELTPDRLNVAAFHLEDRNRRSLDATGSLGTRDLRVGDVAVDIRARGFEVLRNILGTVEVDANLTVRGSYDAPRLFGDVTIAGGELRVDEVLSRALFQPYSTEAIVPGTDVIAALNPWDRLSLDVAVHSQNALRMTGENVAVSENAPLGLGSFNLRASGDVFLYKEPGGEMSVTGSLDSISGSYAFQGRRFELYPSSSVDFRGDLNPGLFISVNRVISGVEARVTIAGTLREPELRLSSSPPLDPSDVLSLIVFNTSANELSTAQQRELAVRAGTLAVGFLTSSLTTALERTIGLDVLEIEPTNDPVSGTGARLTIGQEIAPRLVVRFSRQFGAEQYDEAIMEYLLARILRVRASFSDASNLASRSPFRRVDPAGIDLLFFFSF